MAFVPSFGSEILGFVQKFWPGNPSEILALLAVLSVVTPFIYIFPALRCWVRRVVVQRFSFDSINSVWRNSLCKVSTWKSGVLGLRKIFRFSSGGSNSSLEPRISKKLGGKKRKVVGGAPGGPAHAPAVGGFSAAAAAGIPGGGAAAQMSSSSGGGGASGFGGSNPPLTPPRGAFEKRPAASPASGLASGLVSSLAGRFSALAGGVLPGHAVQSRVSAFLCKLDELSVLYDNAAFKAACKSGKVDGKLLDGRVRCVLKNSKVSFSQKSSWCLKSSPRTIFSQNNWANSLLSFIGGTIFSLKNR